MALRRRRQSQGNGPLFSAPVLGAVAGGILLIVAVVWVWGRSGADPDSAPPPTAVTDANGGVEAPAQPDPELPELSRSDEFVRDALVRLSSHPQLASWLVTEGLVHRFVASVAALAGRGSPASHLDFMAPEGEFLVREAGDELEIDPATYRRHALAVETFVSLDTEGTAELYERLYPLFEEAHQELGLGEQTFQETLELAVSNVLAVSVPQGAVRVYPSEEGVGYTYADARLEQSSPTAKHLVRAGPENARRIQGKVEELARAIGIETN